MEIDHDGVCRPSSRLPGRDQVIDVVGRRQTGLGGGGGPRCLQIRVDDLGGRDDGDVLPVDRCLIRRERLRRVLADAENGVPALLLGGQGHLQPGGAAILPVIVGLGDQRDAGSLERGDGRRRCIEHVLLRLRVGTRPIGEGRFKVGHGEVGSVEQLGDGRAQCARRIPGQAVTQGGGDGKVHVAPEGQGDRPAVTLPIGFEPRVVHRRDAGLGLFRRQARRRRAPTFVAPSPGQSSASSSARSNSPAPQRRRMRRTRREVSVRMARR